MLSMLEEEEEDWNRQDIPDVLKDTEQPQSHLTKPPSFRKLVVPASHYIYLNESEFILLLHFMILL